MFFPSLCPVDDQCSRRRCDDPWRGLCLRGGLRIWLSVHHRENPQPHPRDAQTAAHPASRGDVLAPPQDGRLVPHLLPAECEAEVQGHVSNCIWEVLGRPHEAALRLGLNQPPSHRWFNGQILGPTVRSGGLKTHNCREEDLFWSSGTNLSFSLRWVF